MEGEFLYFEIFFTYSFVKDKKSIKKCNKPKFIAFQIYNKIILQKKTLLLWKKM